MPDLRSDQPTFICADCGKSFTLRPDVLARYPGWQPRQCLDCKNRRSGGAPARPAAAPQRTPPPQRPHEEGRARPPAPARQAPPPARKPPQHRSPEQNVTTQKVLERYTEGPRDGVFTDGACSGNPGPGGWGVVWVQDDAVVDERWGHEPHTTNNRMELTALINAFEMLPADAAVTIWSDSNLCVRTINEWAAGWKALGWKRKKGPVENLDLVERAYELSRQRPKAKLRWIKAHDGSRWNEYADALATSWQRAER